MRSVLTAHPIRLLTVAALVLSVASVLTGASAGAYPPPQGTGTASCTPATQDITVNFTAKRISCDFTFKDASNAPEAGAAVTYVVTPSPGKTTPSYNTFFPTDYVTDAAGHAHAYVGNVMCPGSPGPITVTITGSTADASATTTTTVNCVAATPGSIFGGLFGGGIFGGFITIIIGFLHLTL